MEDVIEVGTTTEAVKNPFASRNPRPALEDLLDMVSERDQIRFARLDNALLEGGAFRELYYYGTSWGWAVRYRHGRQTLMTVHFLPSRIEVTVALSERQAEMVARDKTWPALWKKTLKELLAQNRIKWFRVPMKTNADVTSLMRAAEQKIAAAEQRRGSD
jgi:hypothetical protein